MVCLSFFFAAVATVEEVSKHANTAALFIKAWRSAVYYYLPILHTDVVFAPTVAHIPCLMIV
jgi:hypothetical protein